MAFKRRTDSQASVAKASPLSQRQSGMEHATPGDAAKELVKLMGWDKIAAWQRDNEFIHSAYRPESNSIVATAQSLFYLHNESINVYSHLIGAVVFLLLGLHLYTDLSVRYPSCTTEDIFAFAAFILSAAACFFLSAFCHLFSSHSHAMSKIGTSMDYLGIVVFIEGTCLSGFYYGLREHITLLYFYWIMILLIGALCTVVALSPTFHTPAWRPLRATTFVSLGLFSLIPILHGIYLYGFKELEKRMGLRWSFVQGFFYILGCVIFASRVPERWHPGRYDTFGASHQVFHLCALAAAASQLKALLLAFDYLHSSSLMADD
ncbi:hemolysin-III related-domain-containing protein [Aspergillus venezuelensis]